MDDSLTSQTSKPLPPLIFIVDDELLVVELLETGLSLAGYQTQSFLDPLEALRDFNLAQHKPDILVSDFTMPSMNGIELIQRCKDKHPALKTICISGVVNLSELEMFCTKSDRFISKPLSSRDVIEAVNELMQQAR